MSLLPRGLFARLMLIWLFGITLVLAVSFVLFVGERDRIGRTALFEGVAQEIASAANVLDRLEPDEREPWFEQLGRRRLHLTLRPLPDIAEKPVRAHPLEMALKETMPTRDPALYIIPRGENPHRASLGVTVNLADGSPLRVRLPGIPPAPEFRLPPLGQLIASLAALVGGVLILTWLAVRLATRPLSRMTEAARKLGEAPENSAPLDTSGPLEVAQAAGAFNQMQARVRDHIQERTRILAAISHDLQTPVTRLRLRTELVDDENLREKFIADLDAMRVLIREGLDYARSREDGEPLQAVDIDGLLAALCGDAEDMGWQVTLTGKVGVPCPARAQALRRALWNLIGNGVKFGGGVEITLARKARHVVVSVRDHGPGLPEDELEKVFEPFYRVESSRNRETGGTGLGLAIVRNLLHGQGGEIVLENHPEGGLVATLTLGIEPVPEA